MSGEAGVGPIDGELDVEDGTAVLLLAPANSPVGEECCVDLLTVAAPERENLLVVTTGSVDDRVDAVCRRTGGRLPRRTAVVSVGGSTRSAAGADVGGGPLLGTDVVVETVANPGDLTGIGMRVSEHLGAWTDDDARTVVCVDSLDALLQHADLSRLFRFLHVLTGRLRTTGAVAHCHLDPTAHDAQTVDTLLQLFDAAVEVDDEGETSVRQG